jgi:gliding motility-associated-like protein
MKSASLLVKRLLPILVLLLGFNFRAAAQMWNLPHCSGNGAGKIYYLGQSGEIQILDPANPVYPRGTAIFVPGGSKSLAIATNPFGGPNPTYYTIATVAGAATIHYYNGTAFVPVPTPNPTVMNVDHLAGSCNNIYGLDSATGFVFVWPISATANAISVAASITPGGISDLSGDCSGGFWAASATGTTRTLKHYTSAIPSVNDATYTMNGTLGTGNAGLAVIGNRVYYDGTDGKLYTGAILGTTATFIASTPAPFTVIGAQDFASCGLESGCSNKGARDTLYACTSNSPAVVRINATGPGPYNFAVQNGGPATITTSGNTGIINTLATTTVIYRDANCAGVNNIVDTTVIIINNAVIDAGADRTVVGCRGRFIDTLKGTITDTTKGLIWGYDWTPLTNIIQGNTILDSAIINPSGTPPCSKYFLTVTTNTGCSWTDSVNICVADSTPRPAFQFFRTLGCAADTVRFVNTSMTTPYIASMTWNFGDGNSSTDISPTHIYNTQGIYLVTLIAKNVHCTDSFRTNVDVLHTLRARFTVPDTAICANTQIRFTDASTFYRDPANPIDPSYRYDFGEGTTSTLASPTITYTVPGRYLVKMWIQDQLGCTDSFQRYIVVDTLPYVRFKTADTIICEGQAVNLFADYSSVGNTSRSFNLGDGTVFDNLDTIRYSYQSAGTYTVNFTANYRICPTTVFTRNIQVNPFPGAYIGEDTVLCPNGAPIALTERNNINNPAARFLWSTGDTSASIMARDIGTYWARVTIGGCSGTDSLVVNKDCYVDIPNTFTPDGDGNNDYFYPRQFLSRSVNSFKMSIFNRWGQVIFETTSLNGRGWDGRFNDKPQQQGVYVYIIDVSFDNGVKEHYTGNVTLLR